MARRKKAAPLVSELPGGGKVIKTGIYRRQEGPARPATAEVLAELAATLANNQKQLVAQRAAIEAGAEHVAILDRAAALAQPMYDVKVAELHSPSKAAALKWNPEWGERESTMADATELLFRVDAARREVAAANWRVVAIQFFELGRCVERLMVRSIESRALSTIKATRLAADKRSRAAQKRHSDWQRRVGAAVDAQIAKGFRPNFAAACKEVAEQDRVTTTAVKLAVENRWTPRDRRK